MYLIDGFLIFSGMSPQLLPLVHAFFELDLNWLVELGTSILPSPFIPLLHFSTHDGDLQTCQNAPWDSDQ